MFVLNITKKKSRALLFSVVPFGGIPLSPLFLSLTIATHAETAPLPEGAVRSHSTACDDGTFMFPKESRRALLACRLRGGSVAMLRVTIAL